MKKILFLVPVVLLFFCRIAYASNDHMWINQVQIEGDGGSNDEFIELYNPTDQQISINNWSIQYKSSTGSFPLTTKKNLPNVSIPSLGYFLFAGSGYNGVVPADLVQSTIALSGTSTGATIFLVSSNNFVASASDPAIVDKLAYGTGSGNSPESQSAPALSGYKSGDTEQVLLRNGADTDNNFIDFTIANSNPHNGGANLIQPTVPPTPTPTPSPSPAPVPTPTPDIPPAAVYSTSVIISEIFPNPDGSDTGEEWVELQNISNADVDLTGWQLDDEGAVGVIGSSAYSFPNATAIKAQSYLVIDLPDGVFALNNTVGDSVRLFWPDKTLAQEVDYTGTVKDDTSFAMNSAGAFVWTDLVTKDTANQFEAAQATGISSVAETQIKINEIFPNPKGSDSGSEWVEITNSSDQPVYLQNWILDDGQPTDPIGSSSWKIPDQIIYPKSFSVLSIPSGKFALNNTSDTARIFNENKVLIDSVTYSGAKEDESYSLLANNWIWTTPTPNAENTLQIAEVQIQVPYIVINELFPEPARKSNQEEFIELFNPTDKDIDLTGFKIADLSTSHKLEGIIFANGFLTIKKSESNISLNNSGSETVTLTDVTGNAVDSVSYEDAPVEESYDLMPDGAYVWTSALTPGAVNKFSNIKTQTPIVKNKTEVVSSTVGDSDSNLPATTSADNLQPQISGVNLVQTQPEQRQQSFWPWLVASFAANLLFCYYLVKLMTGKGNS